MTCKEIMTPDPSCCVPGDSVAMAAQIMKRNDVGPVPVVSDQHEKRLVGIVTDRDLTLKVLAEGRDPHTTRVDEVMSMNPDFLPRGREHASRSATDGGSPNPARAHCRCEQSPERDRRSGRLGAE